MIQKKSRPATARLYVLIILMVFFWAMNFIVSKVALRSFPPLLLGGLRTTLAGALIVPAFFLSGRQGKISDKLKPIAADMPMLLFLGVLGVALNQLFFVLGMSRTSVAHSALILGLTPVLVLLLAAAIGQERLTGRKIAGMSVALCGILTLNIAKSGTATPLGDFYIFCGGLAFAVFTVFGKKVVSHHSSLTVNTFAYVGGTVFLLPVTLWYAPGFPFASVPLEAWAAILYMALFSSVICYLIYYHALSYIPASRLSSFSYLQPLLAIAVAAVTLGEAVTGTIAGGGALVLAGVWITERGG